MYINIFNYLAKKSLTWSLCTISSLKLYELVLSDFIILITLVKLFPFPVLSVATTFLAMGQYWFRGYYYLISLWTVFLFRIRLYFFNSKRSGVFFLFLVVMYLLVPRIPLVLCSVHSIITCILLPFLAIIT